MKAQELIAFYTSAARIEPEESYETLYAAIYSEFIFLFRGDILEFIEGEEGERAMQALNRLIPPLGPEETGAVIDFIEEAFDRLMNDLFDNVECNKQLNADSRQLLIDQYVREVTADIVSILYTPPDSMPSPPGGVPGAGI